MSEIERLLETMPKPPAAQLLGWTFQGWEKDVPALTVGFDGKPEFLNPAGVVQGGLLTAMIDDTMGPAVIAASGGTKICQTIDLHAHFLRAVKPGAISVRARVTKLGARIAFIDAELRDADGQLCVTASSSANLGAMPGPA